MCTKPESFTAVPQDLIESKEPNMPMKQSLLRRCSLGYFALGTILVFLPLSAWSQSKGTAGPKPRVIKLKEDIRDYQEVLGGPPATYSMESGLVVIRPSESIGKHSTKSYEEALVVFEGIGEMRITGGPVLKLRPHVVLYCPPATEHDVFNTGSIPLKYLYIAAKAK